MNAYEWQAAIDDSIARHIHRRKMRNTPMASPVRIHHTRDLLLKLKQIEEQRIETMKELRGSSWLNAGPPTVTPDVEVITKAQQWVSDYERAVKLVEKGDQRV